MPNTYDFDRKITFNLRRDEAIVLFGFLTREIWNNCEIHLEKIYEDQAESHSLQALLQVCVRALVDTGGSDWNDIRASAARSLLARHT